MIQRKGFHLAVAMLVALGAVGAHAQISENALQPAAVHYRVSLADSAAHLVHITMDIPAGAAERELQLPVWNALYQVRDFSQYVNWVRAKSSSGRPLTVLKVDKSRWRISGAENGAKIEYEIMADLPGPYGAQLNPQHAFFNLAEILMYPVDARASPMQVSFADAPSGWKYATSFAACAGPEAVASNFAAPGQVRTPAPTCFAAENYDRLVDAPVEVSVFQEADFDEGGGHYRVVVDADPTDYDMRKIVPMVRRIVSAATTWMDDRPFSTYLFVYHFPHGARGGGMEHANSTAIDVEAQVLASNPEALPEVNAHEFFHLWNVKRIRPQSLEPVDYTKENYTRALWFSEGVTSTVQDYILLRSGLIDQRRYLERLADQIATLEGRPAHRTQSAEESSLDAWLEKYPYYRVPERSISYYNKGELLGVMLDLALRDASKGSASLRDVFHWMNQNYAQQGRFFPDSEGVRQAAEAVGHTDLGWFFQEYVAGTEEISWDGVFKSVGLRLVRRPVPVADLGFGASANHGAVPTVAWVVPNSEAERAGLAVEDVIVEINGHNAGPDFERWLAPLRPGDTLRVRVRGRRGQRELHWKLGSREEVEFELADVDNITPQQKANRDAWLGGESQGAARP
ncbi:MAG: PDZ domain-containing protein [Acidobacteriia bacterium]|nr:PDZ domain-containing protein [Terriglobia bacterium]